MSDKSYDSLQEMYRIFSEEAEGLERKLHDNLFSISEIDKYLQSIYEQEEEDFRVFSPRSVDSVYKEDIEKNREKKYALESDNKLLYSRLNKLNSYRDTLHAAIEKMDMMSAESKGILMLKQEKRNLQILDIQERERQRIARDIHDTSLQNLTHLVHEVELASIYMDKDVIQAKLELAGIKKNLKSVIEEMRSTIFDLRPMHFDDLGLQESFSQLFDRLKEAHASFDFDLDIEEVDFHNDLVSMTVFRAVQEASANAIQHSGGNKLKVVIGNKEGFCDILIADNGSGFSIEEAEEKEEMHFGISVMKERIQLLGGQICIYSTPEKGTEVRMQIPIDKHTS